jgi:hypothetical protein
MSCHEFFLVGYEEFGSLIIDCTSAVNSRRGHTNMKWGRARKTLWGGTWIVTLCELLVSKICICVNMYISI